LKLSEIKGPAGFTVVRDGEFETLGMLSDPQPGMLAFVEGDHSLRQVSRVPRISSIVATPVMASKLGALPDVGIATSDEPRRSFFEVHNHLARTTDFYWRDFPTAIDESAEVHPRAYVAERNVRIGPGTVVEPGACIHERCLIGASVVIRSGAVLGSEGFQTGRGGDRMIDMDHAGGIRVGDRVRILAGAVVAAAIFRQFTTIGEDDRVGNQAFVSHNVQIGPRCLIGHGSVVNGNVVIGRDAVIGPGATLAHSIRIGEGSDVSLGSAVISDVAAGKKVTGNVAVDHFRYLRHIASME